MAQSHREAALRLFEFAEQQQGFFTTKQAKAAGFAENTHPYHVQVGNWIREHRGIYRLDLFPTADRPDLVLWALWSRNRNEEAESDVQTARGFKLTRPLRTILDLIEAGTVERNFIRQALRQAFDRGLITRQQIRNARMSGPARTIVEEVLRRVA